MILKLRPTIARCTRYLFSLDGVTCDRHWIIPARQRFVATENLMADNPQCPRLQRLALRDLLGQ